MIRLQREGCPDLDAIRALYAASPLRRPIGDPARLQRMFDHANVIISAWDGDRLVGLLRGWTDFAFDGYICDLAVHPAHQSQGLGRRLLEAAQGTAEGVQWVLLASPLAKDYYAKVGWEAIENGWRLPRPEGMPTYEAYQQEFAEWAKQA